MTVEKIRRLLLIPSPRQWKKGTQPTKQTAVGYFAGIIALGITIFSVIPKPPPPPTVQAYDLSSERRAEFLEILRIPQETGLASLRIGCIAWSETSCIAAGEFLRLFSEAGWKISGNQVYKMEPSLPERGISVVTRNDDKPRLSEPPPHLGTWAVMSKSSSIITMALKYMDNPVHFSSDPGLEDNTLGIYFGPDTPAIASMTSDQRSIRRPLMDLLKAGILIEQGCLSPPFDRCLAQLKSWSTTVESYLADGKFGRSPINAWAATSTDPKVFSRETIEKQQNLLIGLFLGLN